MATHKDVARFWVEYNLFGTGKSARGSGKAYTRDSYDAVVRMSYTEDNFYSYNTVVARFVTIDGRHCVLMSEDSHSIATGTHMRYVRAAAAHHHLRVFSVPALGRPGGWNHEPTRDVGREVSMYVHEDNIKWLYDAVLNAVEVFKQCYLQEFDHPEYGHAARIRYLCDKAKGYASFFGIILEQDFNPEPHIAAAEEARMDRLAKFMRPENIKRRNMARARNLLRKAMLND